MKNNISTAVFLLAGRGSRLEEVTKDKPKCLVEVNDIPILHRMLDELSHLRISKIVLVVGYLHKQIIDYVGDEWNGMDVEYVVNHDWEITNNVVSLYMAIDKIKTNFILLEGDIVVSEKALASFIELNMLAVDHYKSYMNGTVVSLNSNNSVEKFYLNSTPGRPKDLSGYYKTVNIYTFSRDDFFQVIVPKLKQIIDSKQVNAYYELAFAQAVNEKEIEFEAINFHFNKWAEIDDQKDLQYAEKLFGEMLDSEK